MAPSLGIQRMVFDRIAFEAYEKTSMEHLKQCDWRHQDWRMLGPEASVQKLELPCCQADGQEAAADDN